MNAPPKSSDLGVRTVSALVMLAIAGTALWLGGMAWVIFVLVVGVGVWFEWSALSLLMHPPGTQRTIWRAAGAVYAGIGCAMLISLRELPLGMFWVLLLVGAVIATDVGAYTFGRLIGGPKIAPRISPSKTWAGLIGGIAGASLVIGVLLSRMVDPGFAMAFADQSSDNHDTYFVVGHFFGGLAGVIVLGALVAVIAQSGDFFESWMKRRAGVKDSGHLIPGHGGLFDRVDGLLAVLFVMGVLIPLARAL
ncbi:MAG: phosphatidate cytidylyltransferase [Sphingomonadaceae bacterium]